MEEDRRRRHADGHYETPKFFKDWMYFVDMIFELYGYHSMPHEMRYAIGFFFCFAPIYVFFFLWCCIHNEKESDPFEEAKFQERFRESEVRRKQILRDVQKKFK